MPWKPDRETVERYRRVRVGDRVRLTGEVETVYSSDLVGEVGVVVAVDAIRERILVQLDRTPDLLTPVWLEAIELVDEGG